MSESGAEVVHRVMIEAFPMEESIREKLVKALADTVGYRTSIAEQNGVLRAAINTCLAQLDELERDRGVVREIVVCTECQAEAWRDEHGCCDECGEDTVYSIFLGKRGETDG